MNKIKQDRKRKTEQVKKGEKKSKLASYKVPKSIYEKAMNELRNTPTEFESLSRQRCHSTVYKYFNTTESPICKQNFMEAAKQAFEGRNFLALYDILSKALELRDIYVQQQVFELIYTAILTDPSIADKKGALHKFALRVKLLQENQVQSLSLNHLLIDRTFHEDEDKDEDEDDNDERIHIR